MFDDLETREERIRRLLGKFKQLPPDDLLHMQGRAGPSKREEAETEPEKPSPSGALDRLENLTPRELEHAKRHLRGEGL